MRYLEDRDLSVGFVVSHPFYGSPGSVLRVRELSTSLSKFGVNVHVYTPYPPKESWGTKVFFHKIPNMASAFGVQNVVYVLTRGVLNNSFFVRHIMSKKNILDRLINGFAKNLVATVEEDIDIIQGEQEIAAAACVTMREELSVPVIASLHNIWPEELVAMGLIKERTREYDVLQEFEQNIMSESDLVVVVSEEMARYLEDRYSLKNGHILVIPPGGRARISQTDDRMLPFKVVYAGLVAKRAHLDLFIESMPFVLEKYPDVRFFITKMGEDLKRIRKLAQKVGVSPEYYWFPESDEFYKFLASCHVGVVTSSDDLPRRMGPAVKLFDYLSVGLPVVANDIGGWTKIVEHEKIGILTDSNPQSFADGMLQLLDNGDLSLRLGERGLELVKSKLNWDESARMLLQKYEDVLR